MSAPSDTMENKGISGAVWGLAIIPLILLGVIVALILVADGGLTILAGPPVEQVTIQRITLPEPGIIKVTVVNDGPESVTIPQVLVDDAYWTFTAEPSTTIPRFGSATYSISYPWVEEETHEVTLITERGLTFTKEIAVAVESPQMSGRLFTQFGLVGIYVGIVPIVLGMLWYPFMRRLGQGAMNFILALTIGLLIFLAVGTWLDALEFAGELPAFWQGVPLVVFVVVLTLGVLLAISGGGGGVSPLSLSYRIATGIGLHNLGEGLAIGAAFALGEAALGTFLILGFTIHNITEGVGIAAPIVRKNPGLPHFGYLALIAGGPAIIGTWVGGFAFNPLLATIFLAIGIGAILQVVWEVGKLVARNSDTLTNWVNVAGVAAGIAVMYLTAFLVKF